MKITAIIACRMGSSRLPGKSLMPIMGQPMVGRMVERVARSRHVSDVVFATSSLTEDDPIADLASELGIGCFRGSAEDVLLRTRDAARMSAPDIVVELLGDNPLVHADLIDDVVECFDPDAHDYAVSVTREYPGAGPSVRKFCLGIRVQVFPPAVLDRCEREAEGTYYRENSTAYIAEHPDRFRLKYFEARGEWAPLSRPDLNLAVNERKNFEMMTGIFERCYPGNSDFTLHEALAVLDADPALCALAG